MTHACSPSCCLLQSAPGLMPEAVIQDAELADLAGDYFELDEEVGVPEAPGPYAWCLDTTLDPKRCKCSEPACRPAPSRRDQAAALRATSAEPRPRHPASTCVHAAHGFAECAALGTPACIKPYLC